MVHSLQTGVKCKTLNIAAAFDAPSTNNAKYFGLEVIFYKVLTQTTCILCQSDEFLLDLKLIIQLHSLCFSLK